MYWTYFYIFKIAFYHFKILQLIFVQIQLYNFIMIQKSKQINKVTSLYLKQFFNNYTIKNQQAQNLNFLSSSLEVLEQLVSNFIQKYHISTSSLNASIQERSIDFECQKQQNLAFQFESLYEKVKAILHWAEFSVQRNNDGDDQMQFSDYKQPSKRWSHRSGNINDEQLYEILNEYKTTIKKNKETIEGFRRKVDDSKNQYAEMKLKKQIIEKQNIYLNSRIQQLQKQLGELQQQKQKFKIDYNASHQQTSKLIKKVQVLEQSLIELREENSQYKNSIDQLKSNYNKILQEKADLEVKVQSEYEQMNCEIKRKMNQLPNLIESKLKDKKCWNMAALQVMTKYMNYSKQNINLNNGTLNSHKFVSRT